VMKKVTLITGCSTGVGLATAVLLGKHGHTVYATMRNLEKKEALAKAIEKEKLDNVYIKELDVCKDDSVNSCFDEIIKKEGRIDNLINNAGYSLTGNVEMISLEESKAIFETNFYGVVRTTKKVIPIMKKHNSGRILQISTVGGIMGFPFQDFYCASKFALEGFSESLAIVLKPQNIYVSVIEPGPIKTDFLENAIKPSYFPDKKNRRII